jgi:4-diphosphocytidyl-2-C-methyl-D-erythritol kinase
LISFLSHDRKTFVTAQAQPRKPAAQLTVFSPAKINLYLNILGKRPDEYHELETVMVPLDFGDQITLQLRKTSTTLECDNPNLPTDDSNLALRAAKLLAQTFGIEKGAKISLRKRIPLAAGLAGGSSNAAAVLRALNQLWLVDAPGEKLEELAAGLGSDVNFFLSGGAALCRGRGERVEPVSCNLSAAVLLANPGFGIPTKWAYEAWAKRATGEAKLTRAAPEVSLLLRALASGDVAAVGRTLFNSLEVACVEKFPVLQLLKDAMRSLGAAGTLMSGSGATVYGLFAEAAAAEQTGRSLREQFGPGLWTQVARFAPMRAG